MAFRDGLQGRVALVTGAGSRTGIGFATARLLGCEGVRLAISSTTDRIQERAQELEAEGFMVSAVAADLTDAAAAGRLANQVLGRFGRIDILVNNAGMVQVGTEQVFRHLVDLDEAEWDRGMAINLKTAFNMTKAVLPGMLVQRYGRIVNVASVTGPLVSNPGDAAYSAAKAGMTGLTRSLALEVAASGVTVNAVLPGWIATGSSTERELAAGRATPVGRSGTPEEVAAAIVFLAARSASYVTGQTLTVDGGNIVQEYKGPAEHYY